MAKYFNRLLTSFARDLAADFMPYFYESVQVLVEVVDHRGKEALDMLEWTFNGLAYLVKYLSRWLVHEFTKVFDTLAAFLRRQKSEPSYIARFAGESLSYLVRKLPNAQIQSAMEHMISDVARQTDDDPNVYAEGVSTMLIEAICSVQETIHSKGYLIITAMLQAEARLGSSVSIILKAVIIAVVYRCSSTAIKDLVSYVVDRADLNSERRLLCLSIIAAVEKGAKVDDWKVLTSAAIRLHGDCIGYYLLLIQVAAAVILYGDRTQSEQIVSYVFSLSLHDALLHQLALVEVIATEDSACYKERVATSFQRYAMTIRYLTNLLQTCACILAGGQLSYKSHPCLPPLSPKPPSVHCLQQTGSSSRLPSHSKYARQGHLLCFD